jgi:hypothetical protein
VIWLEPGGADLARMYARIGYRKTIALAERDDSHGRAECEGSGVLGTVSPKLCTVRSFGDTGNARTHATVDASARHLACGSGSLSGSQTPALEEPVAAYVIYNAEVFDPVLYEEYKTQAQASIAAVHSRDALMTGSSRVTVRACRRARARRRRYAAALCVQPGGQLDLDGDTERQFR